MKTVLLAVVLFLVISGHAQNVGIGTPSPNANAKLDITAADKGLLIPRMDSVHRKAIPNTIGLFVYDSTTKSFWYNNGASWQSMGASGWLLTGNSNTGPDNFLGTTDNRPLLFKVNNQPAARIDVGLVSLGIDAAVTPPVFSSMVAIGEGALHNNAYNPSIYLSATNNTALGGFALYSNTTGQSNTAVGISALSSSTTPNNNTAVGAGCMSANTTGNFNSALGQTAMTNNATGSANVAIGAQALGTNRTGSNNTAIGTFSGQGDASGNTAVGASALKSNHSSNNTALGYNSDVSGNISNATAIGYNAIADASNKIRLGDNNVTVVESNGVFNTVSDGRFKYNIQEDVKGVDFIMQLRPVTYKFDAKKQEDFTKGIISAAQLNNNALPAAFNENNAIKRTGFIAQEVEAAAQKTGFDFDGVKIPASDKQYYSLSYASFVVPLVKAMQEQQQTISTLKKQNELLIQQNELIMKRLEALEKK